MTRDPLYWGLVLTFGVFSGIFGYFKIDKENFPQTNLWWFFVPLYSFLGLVGAVVGAMFAGPLLQISWQLLAGSSTKITWPQPVSLRGMFLLVGTAIGATAGVMTVFLARRLSSTARR